MTESRPACLMAVTGMFASDGGIACVNRLTLRALAERGYAVDVLALGEPEPVVDARYANPGQVRMSAFSGGKTAFVLAVWRALLRRRYEYVFADLVNVGLPLVPLRALGRRYLVWLFGFEVQPPRPNWEGYLGLKYAWKRLAISPYTRGLVTGRYPALPVDVCDLALDPVRHAAALPAEPFSASAPPVRLTAVDGSARLLGGRVILQVGRMAAIEQFKGQDVLVEALPLVQQRFPDAQLVLAGDGDDRPRLAALARAQPPEVQRTVFMPGYVPEAQLGALYQAAYVFTMPALVEGFGLVYIEAMRWAKPCIGSRADAAGCVVQHGRTGLLVDDPTSPRQVAEAICALLAQPGEAQRLGRAGYEQVRAQYLFPHFAERFWSIVAA